MASQTPPTEVFGPCHSHEVAEQTQCECLALYVGEYAEEVERIREEEELSAMLTKDHEDEELSAMLARDQELATICHHSFEEAFEAHCECASSFP